MYQNKLLLFVIFLLVGCGTGQIDSGQFQQPNDLKSIDLHLPVKKITLNNGLRLLVLEDHRLPIFTYITFYDVGGRYESTGITGATHYLEHMMFKGAKKYGPGQFDSLIESAGGSDNAYTSFDSTVYYQKLPTAMLEKIIDLEADRMGNLLLEPESFEQERAVILEERKMRYENSPEGKLYLTAMQQVFKGTPYGLSVIGSEDDIKALNRDTLFEFFHRFYAPNNAVVAIVGDVDVEKVEAYAKKYYGPISRSVQLEEIKKKLDDPTRFATTHALQGHIKLHGTNPSPLFIMAYRGNALGQREAYVHEILAAILGSGQSSYLYQHYVQGKNPLLSKITASTYNLRNNGTFLIGGQLLKNVSLGSFQKSFNRIARKICDEAVDERNLQKIKNQLLVGYYNGIKTYSGLANLLGNGEHLFGDYNHYKEELAIYDSIELHEVQRSCRELFGPNQNVFLSIWNKHRGSKL